jgi:hypothetical protein
LLYGVALDPFKQFFFCSIRLINPFENLTYEDWCRCW